MDGAEKSEQELIAPLLEICLEFLHLLGADGFERERHDAGADLGLGVLCPRGPAASS